MTLPTYHECLDKLVEALGSPGSPDFETCIRVVKRWREDREWKMDRKPIVEGRMKIEPLFSQVLLERCDTEKKSAGGLVLVDTGNRNTIEARVVAVGDDVCDVAVGELVIFNKYRYEGDKAVPSATEITLDGKVLFALVVGDLIGKLVDG